VKNVKRRTKIALFSLIIALATLCLMLFCGCASVRVHTPTVDGSAITFFKDIHFIINASTNNFYGEYNSAVAGAAIGNAVGAAAPFIK
jgi:uncharacterized protein YceK